jgi:hypothetical protein
MSANAADETLNISNSGYHFDGQESISTKRMRPNEALYDSNDQVNIGRTSNMMNNQIFTDQHEDKEGLDLKRY